MYFSYLGREATEESIPEVTKGESKVFVEKISENKNGLKIIPCAQLYLRNLHIL